MKHPSFVLMLITAVYWTSLVWALGWRGILFTTMQANPLARVRDTLEMRWEVVMLSSWPVWRTRVRPQAPDLFHHGGGEPPEGLSCQGDEDEALLAAELPGAGHLPCVGLVEAKTQGWWPPLSW